MKKLSFSLKNLPYLLSDKISFLLLIPAFFALFIFINLILHLNSRFFYPLDLEWMEGGILINSSRVFSHNSLYSAPDANFIPFAYPPFYYFIVALFGKIFGISYQIGRSISIFSILVVMLIPAFTANFAFGQKGRSFSKFLYFLLFFVLSAGLISSDYLFTGSWYDIVRGDSLFLALTAFALFLICEFYQKTAVIIVAGIVLALAFWTKQTAFPFILSAGLYLLIVKPKKFLFLFFTVAFFVLVPLFFFNYKSEGWLWFYIRDIHKYHKFYSDKFWPESYVILFQREYLLLLSGFIALLLQFIVFKKIGRRSLFWLLIAITGWVTASLGASTQWAYINSRLPGVIFTIIFILAIFSETVFLCSRQGYSCRRFEYLTLLLAVGFLTLHLMNNRIPNKKIKKVTPSSEDYTTAYNFISLLKRQPKPVLIPYHPWYSVLAGGKGSFHIHAINDIVAAGLKYPVSIKAGIKARRWKTIIYDRFGRIYHRQMPGLEQNYKMFMRLGHFAPKTFTGNPCSPAYIWEVRKR